MKKFLSFMLAVVMTAMLFVVPVQAYDSYGFEVACFEVMISSGEEYIDINWRQVSGADRYELLIENSSGENTFSADVKNNSYKWIPNFYIEPYAVFELTVYAYNKDNTLVGESDTLNFNIYEGMWDYWGIYGDVDVDNQISVMDATYIQLYLANQYELRSYRKTISDVKADGVITVFDATYIQFFCALIYIDDNRTFAPFWDGGMFYDIVIVEPESPPTVPPTIPPTIPPTTEEPTQPVPTEEPTNPFPTNEPIPVKPLTPMG